MGITLHPDPSGDDWAQITAAFATLRAAGRGWVELEQLTSTPFNIKRCVNGTCLTNAEIRIAPGTQIRSDWFVGEGPSGKPAPMFDFSGSYWFSMSGMGNIAGLISGYDGASPAGSVLPNCAVLFANGDTKALRNIATSGQFGAAAVGIVSCNDIDIEGGGLGNYNPSSPALVVSSTPDWGLWSPYTTFQQQGFVSDIYLRTRLHGLGKQAWTTFMRNAYNVNFEHCLFDNSGRAHILAQGSSHGIVVIGGKCYSELPPTTPVLGFVECGAPDAFLYLKMLGLNLNGLAANIGNGDFTGIFVN